MTTDLMIPGTDNTIAQVGAYLESVTDELLNEMSAGSELINQPFIDWDVIEEARNRYALAQTKAQEIANGLGQTVAMFSATLESLHIAVDQRDTALEMAAEAQVAAVKAYDNARFDLSNDSDFQTDVVDEYEMQQAERAVAVAAALRTEGDPLFAQQIEEAAAQWEHWRDELFRLTREGFNRLQSVPKIGE
jgi:hypothetical protein